jgi:AcrR family transcriptional regulator
LLFEERQQAIALMQESRKTQAQRQAETKRKILAAAVSYIDELGYHRTTIQGVAREAGLTVGAIRHYFPSKEELLAAVLRDGFRKLTFDVNAVNFSNLSVEERISIFVDKCWKHCDSPEFQSILQILYGMRSDTANFDAWINKTVGHFITGSINVWREIFSELQMDDESYVDVILFLFSSLSGMALLGRINQDPDRQRRDIAILKHLMSIWISEHKGGQKSASNT